MKSLTSRIATLASLTLTLANPLQAEPAVDEAQQKIEQVQQKIEQVQRKVEQQLAKAGQALALAQAGAEPVEPPEPPDVSTVLNFDSDENGIVSAVFGTSGRSAGQPLIVRSSNTEAAVMADIQEDLNVMSRILNKNVERSIGHDKRDSAMGIVLSGIPGSRRPESMYLEGYGALFMLNVKFPLVASTNKEEERIEKSADTTWEQTKRELYGPREPKPGLFRGWQESAPIEYEPEKVDELKKDILEALKNGANIRNLKADESIVVAVTGGENGPAVRAKRIKKSGGGGGGGGGGFGYSGGPAPHKVDVFAMASSNASARRQTILTIRVKKLDVDAYSQGKLTPEEFQKKASILAY